MCPPQVPYACSSVLALISADQLDGGSAFADVDMLKLYDLLLRKFHMDSNVARDELGKALERDFRSHRSGKTQKQAKSHRYHEAVGAFLLALTGSKTIQRMVSQAESVCAHDLFLWATGARRGVTSLSAHQSLTLQLTLQPVETS